MRKIIDFLIKNIHSLTFTFLLLLSITQIIDKNYYHSSKFNFFSKSLVNIINEEKQNLVEYFELKEINENLINENNFLRNNYSKTNKIDSLKIQIIIYFHQPKLFQTVSNFQKTL